MKKHTFFKNSRFLLSITLLLMITSSINARIWHISIDGSDLNEGTRDKPIRTISKAARYATANDTILIHKGIYREWVSPENGGISKQHRITYMAAKGEEAWIKGSEEVKKWKKLSDRLWEATVPNTLFGNFNPFAINIFGDWFFYNPNQHLGEVFLNNKSLFEVNKEEELKNKNNSWFAYVQKDNTIIRANFGTKDPNEELAEINVRPTCFSPKSTGLNYITVKGLKISEAATQWAPPTSEQMGIIGPNWSKGWIIEDCEISNSKCSGISLGKERSSGQNMFSLYKDKLAYEKGGFNREIEVILKASYGDWKKEFVGSHLIQNNKIFDCGQAGIVGHLGCAFSTIRHNEIFNINTNRAINGYEIAGIKLHAAIDVKIEHNIIINTTRGIWLDWQAQGTQVFDNIFDQNFNNDIFIEVSHGPTLVYNNISLSNSGILFNSQGVAFFNNLVSGKIGVWTSQERYTPYHFPHSTEVKGFFNNTGGDMRFYNNIFFCHSKKKQDSVGLIVYNNYPLYKKDMINKNHKTNNLLNFKFPIRISNNVYYGEHSAPYKYEKDYSRYAKTEGSAKLEKEKGKYYLKLNFNSKDLKDFQAIAINTKMLGQTFISEAIFENPDETAFNNNKDFFGKEYKENKPIIGPFNETIEGPIWESKK